MRLRRVIFSAAWWRHVRSHTGCEHAAWWCSDGWYCGGCKRSWGTDGRPDEPLDRTARTRRAEVGPVRVSRQPTNPTGRTWTCDGCDAATTGRCATVANPEDCTARRAYPTELPTGGDPS